MLEAARFGLVVHHDDSVREYAYHDQAVLDAAARHRLDRVSMREDFTCLWPSDKSPSLRNAEGRRP